MVTDAACGRDLPFTSRICVGRTLRPPLDVLPLGCRRADPRRVGEAGGGGGEGGLCEKRRGECYIHGYIDVSRRGY